MEQCLLHSEDTTVLDNATHTVIAIWRKHVREALHHLLHQRPTLLSTFLRQLAIPVFSIITQQTDPAKYVLSQLREFSQAVGLGENSIGLSVILRLVKVISPWTAIMVNIKRLLAGRCRGVMWHFTYRTGIEHTCRAVDVGFQFLGYLRLCLY